MKNIKRIISFLFVMVLTLAMTATVFADLADDNETTYKLSVKDAAENHIYEVYQIFTGDYSTNDGEKVLSNIKWGQNGTGNIGEVVDQSILDELNGVVDASDTEKLAVIEIHANLLSDELAILDKDNGFSTDVPAGYYLIKDRDGSLANVEDDAYTLFLVKVVGADVEVEPKSDVPEVEKKVKDINDSEDTQESDWQDSADHDIGDSISFQLTATLANNVTDYKNEYSISFIDTLSAGLTYQDITSIILVDKNGAVLNNDVSVVITKDNSSEGTTLKIAIADVKSLVSEDEIEKLNEAKIIVEYTAELNVNAVIGSTGNENKVKLEYSNNPNDTQKGTTPEDTVIVFTYEVVVNKVDSDQKALEGAAFKLEKYSEKEGKWNIVEDFTVTSDQTSFEFKGLDDGKYRLTETVTPTGYNTIDPIEFSIVAGHTNRDADFENGYQATGEDPEMSELALIELNGKQEVGAVTIEFTSNVSNGSLEADVVNNKGTVLPSTGGIGTTIFYVVGGILVVAAGVLLVARRRVQK